MSGVVQNIVQFAQERGLTTDYDVQAHIHAGLRSAPTTKTYSRWNQQTLARLQAESAETKRLYAAAIVAGDIMPPSKPTLEERAGGDPLMESTQAAIRLLEKLKNAQHGPRP